VLAGCDGMLSETAEDVTVVVDPDGARDECLEGNNGTTLRIGCTIIE
jgi:hypothetical protein